jgi:integrase
VPQPKGQKRKQVRERYYGNKRDAQKRLNELVTAAQSGTYIIPSKLTTGAYCRKWLEGSLPSTVSPTTLHGRYEAVIRLYIEPGIGLVPLAELRPSHVHDLYKSLSKTYAPNTIRGVHTVLHRALSQATTLELLPRNPSTGVELPRCSPSDKDVLREDDIKKLLDFARGNKYYLALVLSVHTGMRAGEVCGLRWQDVDLEKKTVTVRQCAKMVGNRLCYGPPKTKSSLRVISLPDVVVGELRGVAHFYVPGDYVCPWKPANFCHWLVYVGEQCGIRATPHLMRHAHASLLGRLGENAKVIARRLGHSNVATTLNTYTHLVPEQDVEAARRAGDAFS